jgi:antitoxin VapB
MKCLLFFYFTGVICVTCPLVPRRSRLVCGWGLRNEKFTLTFTPLIDTIGIYQIQKRGPIMTYTVAKIFVNGRSQAVRLPKEFRFEGEEVNIRRMGQDVILSPRHKSWDDFFNKTPIPTDDFMNERIDLPPQKREKF